MRFLLITLMVLSFAPAAHAESPLSAPPSPLTALAPEPSAPAAPPVPVAVPAPAAPAPEAAPVVTATPAPVDTPEEYKNVKPGLLLEENTPTMLSAQQQTSVSHEITMTIEDVLTAYRQGKFTVVAQNIMPLAENGYHQAEELLGLMYRSGQGVGKDPDKAMLWLTKAAEANQPLAQHHLGIIYYTGDGVPVDKIKALMWLQIAVLHYPEGLEKKRATEDHDNLAAQMLRRDRERAADMAREWLEKRGEKRLLDAQ